MVRGWKSWRSPPVDDHVFFRRFKHRKLMADAKTWSEAEGKIHAARECDECRPGPIFRIHREIILAQKPPPVARRDSRRVIVP
jgi:hypothetical protein